MEEIIKAKTKEMVEKYRDALEKQGLKFTEVEEHLFRTGISCGIIISSAALASLPVDITFLEPEKKVKEENNLPSLEEYKNKHEEVIINDIKNTCSKPQFRCPKCDGNMYKCGGHSTESEPNNICYEYICAKCGHIQHLHF